MTTVLLAMLITVGVAVAVLALVAIPRVREGEKILAPDGETAMRDARRRAQAMADDARTRAGDVRARAADARTRAVAARTRSDAPAGAAQATPAGATAAGAVAERTLTLPETDPRGEGEAVVDLRERERPESAARQRLARALEWGDPEPGPRHRR